MSFFSIFSLTTKFSLSVNIKTVYNGLTSNILSRKVGTVMTVKPDY